MFAKKKKEYIPRLYPKKERKKERKKKERKKKERKKKRKEKVILMYFALVFIVVYKYFDVHFLLILTDKSFSQ